MGRQHDTIFFMEERETMRKVIHVHSAAVCPDHSGLTMNRYRPSNDAVERLVGLDHPPPGHAARLQKACHACAGHAAAAARKH